MEELRTALENVPDSYEDFVTGVLSIADEYGRAGMIMEHISRHPEEGTSDIIGYIFSGGIEGAASDMPHGRRMAAML